MTIEESVPTEPIWVRPRVSEASWQARFALPQSEFDEGFARIQVLNRGGFGAVSLGTRVCVIQCWSGTFNGETVAYKHPVKHERDSQYMQKCMSKEADLLAAVECPGVVKLRYVLTAPGLGRGVRVSGLVLDYIEGPTLSYSIQQKTVSMEERLVYLLQLAHILQFLHNPLYCESIVFRDFKPSNVMVNIKSGTLMMIDFGIARFLDVDGLIHSSHPDAGTGHYRAPEQLHRREIDFKVDVYAFGICVPEIMTGDKWDLTADMKTTPASADFPSFHPESICEVLRKLTLRCIAVSPENRPGFFDCIVTSIDFDEIAVSLRQLVSKFARDGLQRAGRVCVNDRSAPYLRLDSDKAQTGVT